METTDTTDTQIFENQKDRFNADYILPCTWTRTWWKWGDEHTVEDNSWWNETVGRSIGFQRQATKDWSGLSLFRLPLAELFDPLLHLLERRASLPLSTFFILRRSWMRQGILVVMVPLVSPRITGRIERLHLSLSLSKTFSYAWVQLIGVNIGWFRFGFFSNFTKRTEPIMNETEIEQNWFDSVRLFGSNFLNKNV